jgi:aspartyl-tRNA(Asn)/glutamyl-tRNA(Gln) amidotransferase subunit A
MRSVATHAAKFRDGKVSSVELTEAAIARVDDPSGEGKRVFIRRFDEQARAEAECADRLRAAGLIASPLAGLPISVKDLFDVAGSVTTAGSVALASAPPATIDAPIVARLRAAGAVILGATNMTEFAFSGIGHNPHYDTPRNPWDRAAGRIPGGSSSGAAVAVADQMSVISIGTDTGGSVRIPAALCGLVGFKPTARRVPTDGAAPLSWSLDSIGPLATTVACCAIVDSIIAGEPVYAPPAFPVKQLRLAVPQNFVLDGLDAAVAGAYQAALDRLASAGVALVEVNLSDLNDIPSINAKGGLAAAESYAWHRPILAAAADRYDPRVRARVERGASMTAADYIDVVRRRSQLQVNVMSKLDGFDAMVMPSVAVVAPTLAEVADDADFTRWNMLILRNTTVGNLLDMCSISIPCHQPGTAPVGLMLSAPPMADKRLLSIGRGVEALFAR